jgi:high-affinity nickel-transport protein
MYPLGILFGLGFDTSSEIALLGISSIEATKGTSLWTILILPALFTGKCMFIMNPLKMLTIPLAGMCLLDTIDGALMFSLYIQPAANFLPPKPDSAVSETTSDITSDELPHSRDNHRDPVAFLYYSIVLTVLTVVVAIVIGAIQLLTLILNATGATGKFWDGVRVAGDYYDAIGGGICGCFIIVGGLSVLVYKPWRRWMERRHKRPAVNDEEPGQDDPPGPEEHTFVPGREAQVGHVFGREQTTVYDKGASSRVTATERRTEEGIV